jgi:hypothetical protein
MPVWIHWIATLDVHSLLRITIIIRHSVLIPHLHPRSRKYVISYRLTGSHTILIHALRNLFDEIDFKNIKINCCEKISIKFIDFGAFPVVEVSSAACLFGRVFSSCYLDSFADLLLDYSFASYLG